MFSTVISYINSNLGLITASGGIRPPFHWEKLATLICHPWAGGKAEPFDFQEISSYFRNLEQFEGMSDSVKELFNNTAFAASPKEVIAAKESGKKYIVFEPRADLLLAWEKTGDSYALSVFSAPEKPALPTPHKGGFFSWIFAFKHAFKDSRLSQMLSERNEAKQKIDPLAACYQGLPPSIFSEDWLSALQDRLKNPLALLAPLEFYRCAPRFFPSSSDEKGWLSRFSTSPVGRNPAFWLYKQWMKQHLPLEDYRSFHFEHRCRLLDAVELGLQEEATSKLLRSLAKKGRESVQQNFAHLKEALLKRKAPDRAAPKREKCPIGLLSQKASADRSSVVWPRQIGPKDKQKDQDDPEAMPAVLKPKYKPMTMERLIEENKRWIDVSEDLGISWPREDYNTKRILGEILRFAKQSSGEKFRHFWGGCWEDVRTFFHPETYQACKEIRKELTLLAGRDIQKEGYNKFPKHLNISENGRIDAYHFQEESDWMDRNTWRSAVNISSAYAIFPYVSPECVLIQALELLRYPLDEDYAYKSANYFFRYRLERFFNEAFMTEEIASLYQKRSGDNLTEKERTSLNLQMMQLREKSESLPWVGLVDDPRRRPVIEKFLVEVASTLEKSQDNIFDVLVSLMLFSARLLSYQKDLIVPDYEKLVISLYKNSSLNPNQLLCLKALLFWVLAEQGKFERANIYRPRREDQWHLEDQYNDPRPWKDVDAEKMCGWIKKLEDKKVDSKDRLEPLPFDWSPLIAKVEKQLDGAIERSSWDEISPAEVSCMVTLSSGSQRHVKIHRKRVEDEIILDGYKLAPLKSCKELPLPEEDLLYGYKDGNSWLIQKSTGTCLVNVTTGQHVAPADILSGYWWDGEPIELTETSCLREMPFLRWEKAGHEELHDHALIDIRSGEVKKHVFHLPPPLFQGDRIASFAIDYQDGRYFPKNLEEQLCLLQVYLESSDLENAQKTLKSLPFTIHKLSSASLRLLQGILQINNVLKNHSFAHLQLGMQVLETFCRWLENPSLAEKYPVELKALCIECLQTWQFYRNTHQNGLESLLLESRDVPNFAERQLTLLHLAAAEFNGRLSTFVQRIFAGRSSLTSEKVAWRKKIRFPVHEFDQRTFDEAEDAMYYRYYDTRDISGAIFGLYHLFSRAILGRKYIFPQRAERLSEFEEDLATLVPKSSTSEEEILEKRLKLVAEHYDSYAAHVLDYALEKKIVQQETESFGEFLARVEQEKYTKSILQSLGEKILSFLSQIVQLFQARPMAVEPLMAPLRASSTLFHREESKQSIDETIPLLQASTKTPKNDQQKEIRNQILAMVNQSNQTRDEKLKMQVAQEVQWSHLEGLFARNAFSRLQMINDTLSENDCQKLDRMMHDYYLAAERADYQYDPAKLTDTVRALLVLESVTGMTVRKNQVEKLNILLSQDSSKGHYRSLALQMGMGGGKTSILASIALLMAAKPGRIALFVPLAAQFDSLAYGFAQWQKERFQQETIPIHLPPHLLYEKNTLQWIKKQIELAKREGYGLLIHPATLHHLQLCWRSSSEPELLQLALSIRQEFLENGDALLDEVDKMLYPLKDTSLTVGPEKYLLKSYISSFRSLIALHEKDPLVWEALLANKPQQIDVKKYRTFQREVLAKHLAKQFSIPIEHQPSFQRYLVGEAAEAQDGKFLKWLHESAGTDLKDLINIHNHWLEDVLPHAILKERGRHYGRKEKHPAIVSYDGVANPSLRKFAQPGEEISYYFLNALSTDYDEALLKEVVDHYRKVSSLNPVRRPKIEAKVYELLGCSLKELESPEAFSAALEKVNREPKVRLELEEYFVQRHLVYHAHQVTSTSQSFLSMFSTHRGFSGTFPQFIHDFDHEIEDDPTVDQNVEKTVREHNEPVLISDAPVGQFFSDIAQALGPVNGLIDIGARFKDFPHREIAKQALLQLDGIEYALFFGKAAGSDAAADTPMLLQYDRKTKTFHQHILSSTKKEVLASWGVDDLSKLFVYFDERHCEAIDVEQLMRATNICTFGIHTTKRDLFQGVMRMRNYQGEKDPSTRQKALFVLDVETHKNLFSSASQSPIPEELIQKAKEIEAKETALCSPRTYYHAIDAAFFAAAEEVLADVLYKPEKLSRLQSFFQYLVVSPSPSEQFGGIYITEETYKHFQNYIERRKQELKKVYPASALPDSLLKKLQKIDQNLQNALQRHLKPEISHKQKPLQLSQEQQQKQRQEQQQQQETKILSRLKRPKNGDLWVEQRTPARYDLASHYAGFFGLSSSFLISKSFDSKLLGGIQATENWLRTYTSTHALNHPAQKKACFVLLERKEGKIVPTILSLYDYQTYLRYPETLPATSCICLTKPFQNSSLTPCLLGQNWSADLSAEEEQRLKKLWMQLAFINADPFYIVAHWEDLGERLTQEHLDFLRERVKYWSTYEFELREERPWPEKRNIEHSIRQLEEALPTNKLF